MPEVPGLHLWEDFCTEAEEAELLSFLDTCQPPWRRQQFGVPTLYRSKHFGVLASLRPREVREPDPALGEVELPSSGPLADLARRLRDARRPWGAGVLRHFAPNEANVNDYRRAEGDRLHLHWDDRGLYDEQVCSLSLLGEATMSFALGGRSNLRPGAAAAAAREPRAAGEEAVTPAGPVVRVRVPARSLLVLTGPARFEWQHGFPDPSDFDCERRVAVIFRRVRTAGKPKTKSRAEGAAGLATATPARAVPNTGPVASAAAEQAPAPAVAPGGAATGVEDALPSAPAEAAVPSFRAAEGRALRAALIISTNWPDPNVSAAGLVTSGRIALLRELCGNVAFASAARPGDAKGRLAAANDVECIRITVNDEASVLSALEATQPQLVIFDGFNAEERFGHYVCAALPVAMRVLDMQDFHALRVGREQLVAGGASAAEVTAYRPDATEEALLRELASVHRCDATLAISEDERALLVDVYRVPPRKVHAAPFGHPPAPALADLPGWAERQGAMFIGNWRHRPNRDCARWLVHEVWPHVRARLPDLELSLFGANQAPEDAALSDEGAGILVRGHCRCVATAMRWHRLLVAPLRFGAGVKGKITDAMRNGLVAVTTPVGAEGIARGGEAFPGVVVKEGAEDAEGFASALVDAYRDAEAWTQLQARALELVAGRFDAAANGAQLRGFLAERWEALPSDRRTDFVGQMAWHSSLRSTEWMAKYIAAKEELQRLKKALVSEGAE